ncbi:hypothetical protein D1P53_004879 [Cryptococcus gattii VGV]|nr:hypothetical protein D1P53_004879 [Cryptococcus gattii VGV]
MGDSIVGWQSKWQATASPSTLESECVAMSEAAKYGVYLQRLLDELGYMSEKVPLNCDNVGAISLANNSSFHSKTKHIDIRVHMIREKLSVGTRNLHHSTQGIRALLQRDRCLEEQRRLDAELVRMLRWAEKRSKTIIQALDECMEKGNALEALEGSGSASHGTPSPSTVVGSSPLRTSPAVPPSSPSPAPPHNPSSASLSPTAPLATSFFDVSSSAAVTSTFHEPTEAASHSIYMLGVLQKKHLRLLKRWVQDGLLYLWADESARRLSDWQDVSGLAGALRQRVEKDSGTILIAEEEDDVPEHLRDWRIDGTEVAEVPVSEAEVEKEEVGSFWIL